MLQYDAIPTAVADLLHRLKNRPALTNFALGGGTSLALRRGHRISVDLDFFTEDEFPPNELFSALSLENATVLSSSKNSLTINANGVKVDLLRHAFRELAPIDKIEGVSLISQPDLAAMKLNAIANRGSKKDFYDLVELMKDFQLSEMIRFFSKKYPTTDPFVVIRSLAWFEDADAEPDPVALVDQSWPDIKDCVLKSVAEL